MNYKRITAKHFAESERIRDLATLSAIEYIKEEVARIFKKRKRLTVYMQCMGTACFWEDQNSHSLSLEDRASFKNLRDFMLEYDNELCLTGWAMKIYPDGTIKTDW